MFGSPCSSHASRLRRAPSERIQCFLCLHHKDAEGESQWVRRRLLRFFLLSNKVSEFSFFRCSLVNAKVLGLPSEVQELCPDIPELDSLLKEIGDLAESGARYTEMPHVIEITLPMLCNYLPRWWERGFENFPEMEGQLCTEVTSEHLNQLLGSIMKIVVNNLGIDEASWMKRLAGELWFNLYQSITAKSSGSFCTNEITPFCFLF